MREAGISQAVDSTHIDLRAGEQPGGPFWGASHRGGCRYARSRVFVASPVVLPRCDDDPIQNLVEDRHRGCEIEPDKLRAIGVEGLAGAEAESGLVQEELECGV